MVVNDRLRRLEDKLGVQPCGACPFEKVETLELTRVLYPDGTENFIHDPRDTDESFELCDRCPYADDPDPPIQTIVIERTVRVDDSDA